MIDPSRVRVDGPLARFAGGFRIELARQGYAPGTVAGHLFLMGHLSRWLAGRGLDDRSVTPELIRVYLAERRAAGYVTFRSGRGLAPLLEHLRRDGVVPLTAPVAQAPIERLFERYARFSASERGLAPSTIRRNVDLVRPFLTGGVGGDLRGLTAGDVRVFMTAAGQGPSRATVSRTATALRSLLRFLHVEGLIDQPLVDAVPSVASWKLAGLPKTLRAEQVAALLDTCDRDTVVGRRDFAILTLLLRLGLRAGEIAALRLDDIDWRHGEITVRGKGNRSERLPLPVDVGQAVVSYLRCDGRAVAAREVFARVRAPHGPLGSPAVTAMVASRGRRAGLGTVHAHRLRHTAATGMLRAGGSLAEIGQVLRHRHALTTAIYAKTDLESLRALARPWPVSTP